MGHVHLRALRASRQIELAGVVEPVTAVRDGLVQEGVSVWPTIDDLLAERGASLDGVLVAAPSDQHVALVSRLAATGISVLCEKPLGVRTGDAADAAAAAAAAGIVLQVGYWRRFVPALQQLRERVTSGHLGQLYQVSCMQWDAEPPTAEFSASSGGIAIDMGVHEFDQIRWLTGQDIVEVDAVATAPSELGDPDCAVILARLSGGTAAVVSLGRRFPYADSCWLEVWGKDGYERLPFMWDADVWSPEGAAVFDAAMLAQAEAFARAIRGEPKDGAGGEDAVAALRAAEASTESFAARAGAAV
jgi:myo-inositol 2-dehydrogenase/D-chiro-inositol 1-dehydrogenase